MLPDRAQRTATSTCSIIIRRMNLNNSDPYRDFAAHYDRFEGAFDQHNPAEVEFLRRLFLKHRVQHMLDCACGTGHHLHLCAGLGLQVVGSDISAAMLAQAAKNLSSTSLDIPLYQQDFRSLPECFEAVFDAVLCLRSSILHMPDETEALRAFRSMHAVLRPDGILVLSQGTSDRQWREKPRFIVAVDKPDLTRLFVIDYLSGNGARYNIVDIQRGENEDNLQVWSVEYAHMLLKDDQERLLLQAGFDTVYALGGFDFTPYDKENSQRLIVVAKK